MDEEYIEKSFSSAVEAVKLFNELIIGIYQTGSGFTILSFFEMVRVTVSKLEERLLSEVLEGDELYYITIKTTVHDIIKREYDAALEGLDHEQM